MIFAPATTRHATPRADYARGEVSSKSIPVEELHRLFILTEDGRLVNRHWRSSMSLAGQEAGHVSKSNGYRYVGIGRTNYLTHRVVYAMTRGHWPINDIDHIDGNRTNNRPSNLRDVTASANAQNRRHAPTDNVAGLLGVVSNPSGTFGAGVWIGRTCFWLGCFATKGEASEVYRAAKKVLHPFAADVQDVQTDCFSTCETAIAFRRFLEKVDRWRADSA